MTEEDRSEIVSTIENDANLEDAEEYRRVAEIRIQLDNNRQLTRIADQGELRMALSDEPAPDALVEAVMLISSDDIGKWVEYADSNGIERERIITDYNIIGEFDNDARYAYPARDKLKRLILEHALTDHEKAVR